MPAFFGKDLVVTWTSLAGTITMNTDFQTFQYDPSIAYADQTAGNDTSVTRLPGLKDGKAVYKGLLQAGTLPAWGTALAPGTFGTIVFQPEGTAAGKFAGTIPAYVDTLSTPFVYNALVEANVSWLQSGDYTKGVN